MKKKKWKMIFFRIFIMIITIALTITIPFINLIQEDDANIIYNAFVGSKAKYQGIIEVWNIDTFESGTAPKSNYIKMVAKSFEKNNKGIYILVKNLTETECFNLLSAGNVPDLFSCSYGIANKIKKYITPFSNLSNIEIKNKFLEIGKDGVGNLYGLAWCYGFYCLISCKSNLQKANINLDEKIKLSKIVLSCGYTQKTKKSSKNIYSVGYSKNKYLLSKNIINSYNKNEAILNFDLSTLESDTQYLAYSNFIAGNNVILLGSQRDIFRVNNRQVNGKISDVIYEPIFDFTDLIQFIFLSNNDNKIKQFYAEEFAKTLTKKIHQEKINTIGMLSVFNDNYEQFNSIMTDIVLDYLSDCKVFNVFD